MLCTVRSIEYIHTYIHMTDAATKHVQLSTKTYTKCDDIRSASYGCMYSRTVSVHTAFPNAGNVHEIGDMYADSRLENFTS